MTAADIEREIARRIGSCAYFAASPAFPVMAGVDYTPQRMQEALASAFCGVIITPSALAAPNMNLPAANGRAEWSVVIVQNPESTAAVPGTFHMLDAAMAVQKALLLHIPADAAGAALSGGAMMVSEAKFEWGELVSGSRVFMGRMTVSATISDSTPAKR